MRISRIQSFVFGFLLPFESAKLLKQKPKLLLWAAIPLCITLFIYFKFIIGAQDAVSAAMNAKMIAWGIGQDSTLGTAANWIAKIIIIILGVMTFTFVSTLVSSPFNDFLAEATETYVYPRLSDVPGFNWTAKARLLMIDIAKTVAATLATLVALLISWVPFLNAFGFMLAALLICFQYTSYPQTRRGVTLVEGIGFLWRYFYVCLGFGIALSVLFAIPLISSFTVPLAVIGGTILVARAPGDAQLPALR